MNEATKYLEQMQTLSADVDNFQAEFTSQDKIAYLKRYKAVDKRIEQECEELSKWHSRATKVTPTYSDMPKGGESSDKIQSAVESMMEIEDQINVDIDELVKIKAEIVEAIKTVKDEKLSLLLRSRYIADLTWEKISVLLNYDVEGKNVYKLHKKAIQLMKVDTVLHL